MNGLPAEVLSSIASFLSVSEQLKCIRVCKKWHEIITNTVLYEKIEFNNNQTKFSQVLSLLQSKKYAGKHVRRLSLCIMNIDTQIVSTLPTLFPNIKSLLWTERQISIDHSAIPAFEHALKNWNNLEKIYQHTPNIRISTHLLRACICNRLKDITIRFSNYDGKALKELIENIHNVSLLEKIELHATAINMADLEILHNKLPKLKEVDLNDIRLDEKDTDLLVINSAKFVQSFTLHPRSPRNSRDVIPMEFEHLVAKWLFYIGQKYQNLQKLDLCLDNDDDTVHETSSSILEDPLASALTNMKNLNSYAVKMTSLTKHTLDTFEKNGIRLKKLKLKTLKGNEQVQKFFLNIQSSESTLPLEALQLDIFGNVDTVMLARTLTNSKFDYLTLVNISGDAINGFPIAILQNLTQLETLIISSPFRPNLIKYLTRYPTETVAYFYEKLDNPRCCQLFTDILNIENASRLRDEVANTSAELISKIFKISEQPATEDNKTITNTPSSVLHYRGVMIVYTLVNFNSDYLTTHREVLECLLDLWRQRQGKLLTQQQREEEQQSLMVTRELLLLAKIFAGLWTYEGYDQDSVAREVIRPCGLKNLIVDVYSYEEYYDGEELEQLNYIQNFIIPSCLLLEQFKLSASLRNQQPDTLSLNYLHHARMKIVDIDMGFSECYYTINNDGKKWKRYNNTDKAIKAEFSDMQYGPINVKLECQDRVRLQLGPEIP